MSLRKRADGVVEETIDRFEASEPPTGLTRAWQDFVGGLYPERRELERAAYDSRFRDEAGNPIWNEQWGDFQSRDTARMRELEYLMRSALEDGELRWFKVLDTGYVMGIKGARWTAEISSFHAISNDRCDNFFPGPWKKSPIAVHTGDLRNLIATMRKAQEASSVPPRRGRPPKRDMDIIKTECFRLMDLKGEFHDGWDQVNLENALMEYATVKVRMKNGLPRTTLVDRKYLPAWLGDWRNLLTKNP